MFFVVMYIQYNMKAWMLGIYENIFSIIDMQAIWVLRNELHNYINI